MLFKFEKALVDGKKESGTILKVFKHFTFLVL
jgi:hypothetical protein